MTRTRDICLVTCDIAGPIRNGGIGTAYCNMAAALTRAGHRVTVLYALGRYCEQQSIAHWTRWYRRRGITFVAMPEAAVRGSHALRMAYGAYVWLKSRRFDLIHCHEWRGIGFYVALAKHQGLAFGQTTLCIGTHSPTLWHLEGMNELADAEALEVDFMERQSVELADVLWSPSRYLVDWMRREEWKLPRRVLIRQNVLLDATPGASTRVGPAPELVFFGRLETRKGLDLFCDALDRLQARGCRPSRVTFLGKPAAVAGEASEEYLHRRGSAWAWPWAIIADRDRDQAMSYLRGDGRVAVMPSRIDNSPYTVLECLGSGIPFVAAATGGIPELVRAADRPHVLFDLTAEALASRLTEVVTTGLTPARPRIAPARTLADWLRWHAGETAARPRTRRKPAVTTRAPMVSVCITHYNRPAFLEAALDSIRRQDYPHIEAIVVDDGSTTPEAHRALARLEADFARRGWTLVRQPNRYLGAARNTALRHARGTWVLFMDDDNLAERTEVSTFVRAASHSGADILTCLLNIFQSARPVPERGATHVWPFLGGALAPGVLRNVFGDANAFVRRDVFDRIGGFTEDYGVGCEDWEFFARAVLAGLRLEVVPEPLVRYRQSTQGMLSSTSTHQNRMRALRPYLQMLPPHLRPLTHLAGQHGQSSRQAFRLDHVRRAVVFGTGAAGRMALDLASQCGWSVPWLVDNNPSAWHTTAHGLTVRAPDALRHGGFDLVIVASLAGKPAIFSQLSKLGFRHGKHFVHYLDQVQVGVVATQIRV